MTTNAPTAAITPTPIRPPRIVPEPAEATRRAGLTPEEDAAYITGRVAVLRRRTKRAELEEGRLLAECKDRELWKHVDGCESWADWLSLPEVDISLSYAYKLIQYAGIAIQAAAAGVGPQVIEEIGPTKAAKIAPYLTAKSSPGAVQELTHRAATQRRSDLHRGIEEVTGGPYDDYRERLESFRARIKATADHLSINPDDSRKALEHIVELVGETRQFIDTHDAQIRSQAEPAQAAAS